jgi:hypothetical protein
MNGYSIDTIRVEWLEELSAKTAIARNSGVDISLEGPVVPAKGEANTFKNGKSSSRLYESLSLLPFGVAGNSHPSHSRRSRFFRCPVSKENRSVP